MAASDDLLDAERVGVLRRVRRGMRDPQAWQQLVRFGLVGGSGYVVNLAAFALCIGAAGTGHRVAAVVAFLLAVSNNFLWNRLWTFSYAAGRAHQQAWRYLAVAFAAFVVAFLLLEALVALDVPELGAQAVAVVLSTPIGFLGNKLWTFSDR